MGRLAIGNDLAGAALFVHAIEMMQRPGAAAEGMGMGDGSGDVGFGEQDGFGKAPTMSQMAGEGGGKSAAGAVGRVGALALGFEDFLLNAVRGGEAEEIDGFVEVAAGYGNIGGSEGVEAAGGFAHDFQGSHRGSSRVGRGAGSGCSSSGRQGESGQSGGFLEIGGDDLGHGKDALDHKTSASRIEEIGCGSRFEDGVEDDVRRAGAIEEIGDGQDTGFVG